MLKRLFAVVSLTLACQLAYAHDHAHEAAGSGQPGHETMKIEQVWSRAVPPTPPTGAVYFTLHSHAAEADRLVGAHTPRAEKAELHTHVHQGDVMRMERVEAVDIPADGHVEFKPGGNHVMLFGVTEPLVAGEHFPITLEFEKAGEITLEVTITDQAPASHQH
ncbi:copper chaperone PCu(A)C [Stutzerimonas azotifigens]|uniref:Copper chaperone PCu(A)C n=1 Tax=Stutzerimonas azotifigens TaxID=291995 RepID=A0ABR5Z1H7_9GAMM|nr:copper chaperone PCu(A)C [Stutzerimonas azotifigens]MBA1274009.1 copper chaperone PCu(A)C [Stutzerimonas azotifigens]